MTKFVPLFRGCVAHEVQVGPVVVQRFFERRANGHRWHVWIAIGCGEHDP